MSRVSIHAPLAQGVLVALLLLTPLFVFGATECGQLDKNSAIPTGYGSPVNLFSLDKELLVRVSCETSGEVAYFGSGKTNQYVYKDAYEWRSGWQKVNMTGGALTGDWYIGSAQASLAPLPLGQDASSGGFVAAYVCQNIGNNWKCGCRDSACSSRYWQLQTFPKSTEQSAYQAQVENDLANSDDLMVAYPSRYDGSPGMEVTLLGSGFTPSGNTILFNGANPLSVSASNSSRITFAIPNLPPDVYRISVRNSKGTSNDNNFIAITAPGAQPPTITSITPFEAVYGGSVTITGKNFAPTGNYVLMTHHVYTNITSTENGTKIVLPLTNIPLITPTPPGFPKQQVAEVIYIANKNGVTPKSGGKGFKLEI